MENIIFRGKTETGEWVYGGINDTGTAIVKQFQFIPVDPQSVGMFTGFRDSAGNMVYEGDIIHNKFDMLNNSNETVFWNSFTGAFNIKRINQPYTDFLDKKYIEENMEVVGSETDV